MSKEKKGETKEKKVSLREELITLIGDKAPIKATEIAATPELVLKYKFDEISHELDKLVKEEEIIEVEYTLPSQGYRIKSLYFPKGTIIPSKGEKAKVVKHRMFEVVVEKRTYCSGLVNIKATSKVEAVRIVQEKIDNGKLRTVDVEWGDYRYEDCSFNTTGDAV